MRLCQLSTSASVCASLLCASLAHEASANILIFNSKPLYDVAAASYDQAFESFNSYSGSYTSPLTGVANGVTWSATSASGFVVNNGQMSTAMPGEMVITFSGVEVYGVYGNFFGTDANGDVAPGLVFVTLADGTGSLIFVDNANIFFGFVSTGAAITSISASAQAFQAGLPVMRASVDNLGMSFVVPAPGALAILGLAGLIGRRRR
jgi:hypothetical protein